MQRKLYVLLHYMTKFRTIDRQGDGFHALLCLHLWVLCKQEVLLTALSKLNTHRAKISHEYVNSSAACGR